MTESANIPTQLQRDDICFIPIPRGEKGPKIPEWNKPGNTQKWDSSKLEAHLKSGGNYGMYPAMGSDLLFIDIDNADEFSHAGGTDLVGETYQYSAWPDKHKYRAIVECPDIPQYWRGSKAVFPEVLEIFFPVGLVSTEARDPNNGVMKSTQIVKAAGQVVGPGSLHPNGNIYQPFNEKAGILAIAWEELKEVTDKLGDGKLDKMPQYFTVQGDYLPGPRRQLLRVRYNLSLVMPDNPYPRGNEIRGANPFHGSTSKGGNTSVNPHKGVFYCFRCNKGYDAAGVDAIRRGLIECGDDYTADVFQKHVAELEHDFPKVRIAEVELFKAKKRALNDVTPGRKLWNQKR